MITGSLLAPLDRRAWHQATTLREAGYAVSVICPKGQRTDQSREVIDGIHVYRLPMPPEAKDVLAYMVRPARGMFFAFLLAWRVLLTRGFDIVHAGNPPATAFFIAGFFRLFLGRQFVFDHRDLSPEHYEAKSGRHDLFYRLLLRLERWTFRAADICLAANHSSETIAAGRGGMRLERVFIVRSGPKPEQLTITPAQPELKNGRAFLVACAGAIDQQAGIDSLLRSAAHIVHALERQDVHVAMAGDGPALEEMKQLALRLGVEAHVTFAGRLDDDALLALLNTADICADPAPANAANDQSTNSRIMDYMALKKPIVQFDLTEGRFSAGDASLYADNNDPVDFAERVLELLADPERRARMGAHGYRRVCAELAWNHQAPKLIAAYAALERLRFKLPVPEPEHLRAPRIRSQIARPICAAE